MGHAVMCFLTVFFNESPANRSISCVAPSGHLRSRRPGCARPGPIKEERHLYLFSIFHAALCVWPHVSFRCDAPVVIGRARLKSQTAQGLRLLQPRRRGDPELHPFTYLSLQEVGHTFTHMCFQQSAAQPSCDLCQSAPRWFFNYYYYYYYYYYFHAHS